MKRTYKVILINYANKSFRKSQKLNSQTGKKEGLFDKVISYKPTDIDKDFAKKNIEILKQKRGNGYWLWKPYFIKKTLEQMNFGDFLFYCDSGSYFTNSIQDLITLSIKVGQDIIPFELAHLESSWTKRDAFVLMNCEDIQYYNTNQRLGGFILIKKTELSMSFVDNWINFAQDKRILTDLENVLGLENYSGFKEHRHDQSIFSLLTKKYGFIAFRDPSQFGTPFEKRYPDSTYNEFIFLNRKRNLPLHIEIKKYLRAKKDEFKKKFRF